ncbi:peroxisomal leader peptide-processing protease isoform X2 [Ambystoma mexicanum]|uniref:peroxisomal leader peptide-processing protease isoform X2 n=1 Tax=Ambystoma mexicanum TaxID=8296 RepID=UPI0037E8A900
MQAWEQCGCVVSASGTQTRSISQGNEQLFPRIGGSQTLGTSQGLATPALDEDGPWSCSGVIVDQSRGIVLCHGSIFSPFLLEGTNLDCSERKRLLFPDDFSEKLAVEIQCSTSYTVKGHLKSNVHMDLGASNPKPGMIPLSNQVGCQKSLRQHQAQLLMMVPCQEFHETFHRLFNKAEGWRFSNDEDKLEHEEMQKGLAFLHWFAVVKIKDPVPRGTEEVRLMPSASLQKGNVLFTCGSPFGMFYPDIFLNTLSKGVVSNVAGEGNVVILTDARCLPGTEGGAVYARSGGNLALVGLIVVPLCWKANEWVGLTIACSISHILDNLKKALPAFMSPLKDAWPRIALMPKVSGQVDVISMLIPRLASVAVLVDCGQVWGSGVLVNARTVLTCRHVVSGATWILVRRQHQKEDGFCAIRGTVVFATKEASPFDIAVVDLEKNVPGFVEPVLGASYSVGEDVSIIAFGAFGKHCGPSVTSGILSAVIDVDSTPVMLQTTCAVHGGSSGGPLFATRTGQLLGIVASNTRDNSVGATYPHLNFSVPITLMQSGLSRYNKNRDLGGFEELGQASDSVRAVWRLQRKPKELRRSKL